MRIAVVTPYCREPPATLARCIDSIAAQTHADRVHYLVADGFPQPALVEGRAGVRPITLPQAHADYGCTPRAIGALCALNAGADLVCFLDADNHCAPEHLESLAETWTRGAAAGTPPDAIFSRRQIFFPAAPQRLYPDPEPGPPRHVDTSCIGLSTSAAFLWPCWALLPRAWTPICDRILMQLIRHHRLRCADTGLATVRYESNWAAHYRACGLPVPETGLHDDTVRNLQLPSAAEVRARLGLTLGPRAARPASGDGGSTVAPAATP